MKITTVRVVVSIEVEHNEDMEIEEILQDMHYSFATSSEDESTKIVTTEIQDWEIV